MAPNSIIRKDLKLRNCRKGRVHKLLPRHVKERKTNCRKLYEKYLAGEKWKSVVTLDETWVYLDTCNKPRAIYYIGRPTLAGLRKSCQQKWDRLDMTVLRKCLLQWNLRCRVIVGQHGHQIEHDRRWRRAV